MKDLRYLSYSKRYLQFILLLAVVLFNLSPVNTGVAHAVVCYTLTLTTSPVVGGTTTANPPPNCGGTQYNDGTIVQLIASTNTGYLFGAWSGGFTGTTNPSNVTMNANKSITTIFIAEIWQNAVEISVPFSATVNTTQANSDPVYEPPQLNCDGTFINGGEATIWYKYTPAANGLVYLDTLGSVQAVINQSSGLPYEYDTYIAVWTGTIDTSPADGNPALVACNDDNAAGYRSQLGFNGIAGTTYYIQVAQYNGPAGSTETPPYNGGTLKFHATSFADVPGDYWAWNWIEGLYDAGVTSGCASSPRQYCPSGTVARDQMAVFLLRAKHGPAYTPPAVGASTGFGDVPTTYWAAAWIKQLAAEGVTSGCGGGNYCPTTVVTRDQMAVFLLRTKYGSAYFPPAVGASTGFGDVPTTYWAAAWIKQLAAEGVTSGCGGGNYCPTTVVTRDQMAIFLDKTMGFPPIP